MSQTHEATYRHGQLETIRHPNDCDQENCELSPTLAAFADDAKEQQLNRSYKVTEVENGYNLEVIDE